MDGCRIHCPAFSRRVSKLCLLVVPAALCMVAAGGLLAPRSAAALALPALPATGTPQVSAGEEFGLAIRDDGSLWAWGTNTCGQLGDGTTARRESPVRVGADSDWALVSAGFDHTLAIKRDGTLWAWGSNDWGQLSQGDTTDRWTPTRVGWDDRWAAVSAGQSFSLALKYDGSLWVWGRNDLGQLGLGDYDTRTEWTRVGLGQSWAAVSAGAFHVAALKIDGSLFAWGRNDSGQLGLGDKVSRNEPWPVDGNTDWVAVDAGAIHTLGVRSGGTLWAWGSNDFGQLGDGSTDGAVEPGRVGAATGWTSVNGGLTHSAGIMSDGTLWAWGDNRMGELGDDTNIQRLEPVRSGRATDWSFVDAGSYFNAGLKSDGSVMTWGENYQSQCGLDTTVLHWVPERLMGAAFALTVTAPSGSGTFYKGDSLTVSWSTPYDPLVGEFCVWATNGGLTPYIGKIVRAGGKLGPFSTTVTLAVPVGGPYRIRVGYRPTEGSGDFTLLASSPGTFAVLATPTATVTAPTASSDWLAGSTQTVSWSLTSALGVGEFRVWLISSGGTWYIARQVLPVAGRLNYSTSFAALVPGGSGYKAAVYWRPSVGSGTWLVTGKSLGFTVTSVVITSPAASALWSLAFPQSVSWTMTPAAAGGQFYVALVSRAGTWYVNRYVTAVAGRPAYSTSFRLTGVPAGSGYTARVYWRPVAGSGGWVLTQRSGAFTVTP